MTLAVVGYCPSRERTRSIPLARRPEMDEDLSALSREQVVDEVRRSAPVEARVFMRCELTVRIGAPQR